MPFTLPNSTGAASLTDAATTEAQQKTNLTNLRGFIAEMLGTDSTGRGTARSLLGIDAPTLTFAVGASAMTVALKSAAGADGSSTAPVSMSFRSATLSSAAINVRQVTAALSLVVSSGSTLGMTNGTDKWLFVYALDNSGTVELAISAKNYGKHFIGTSVAEGGAGAADSATAIYSTTARTSVPMRLLAAVRSNQTTAGTWAAVPVESVTVEGDAWLNGRRMVQRATATRDTVGTTTFQIPGDDSKPQIGEGEEFLTLAFTPTNAASTLKISASCTAAHSVAGASLAMCLFKDAVADALDVGWATVPTVQYAVPLDIDYEMDAGTTSAITFRIRLGADAAGTTTLNGASGTRRYGGASVLRITVEEILP